MGACNLLSLGTDERCGSHLDPFNAYNIWFYAQGELRRYVCIVGVAGDCSHCVDTQTLCERFGNDTDLLYVSNVDFRGEATQRRGRAWIWSRRHKATTIGCRYENST